MKNNTLRYCNLKLFSKPYLKFEQENLSKKFLFIYVFDCNASFQYLRSITFISIICISRAELMRMRKPRFVYFLLFLHVGIYIYIVTFSEI